MPRVAYGVLLVVIPRGPGRTASALAEHVSGRHISLKPPPDPSCIHTTTITMSLAALRVSARRVAVPKTAPTLARTRLAQRGPVARRFNSTQSTPPPPPPKRSNIGLFAVLGLGAAGAGYYLYSQSDAAETAVKSGVQAAKVAANFVPTKADYVKVYTLLSKAR